MPLPKSILCNGCKKTYPEGWRRCPYCGRLESANSRFQQEVARIARVKEREYLDRTAKGKPKEEQKTEGRRGRGRSRRGRRGAALPTGVRDQRPQQRQGDRPPRREGDGPQQQQPRRTAGPGAPRPAVDAARAVPGAAPAAEQPGRGRRRRRRGGAKRSGGSVQTPGNAMQSPRSPGENRPPGQPQQDSAGAEGGAQKRKRRFRRRRPRPGGGSPPSAPQE